MSLDFLCLDSPELQDFLESRNGHVVSLEDSSTLGDDVLDIGYVPPAPYSMSVKKNSCQRQ